MLLAHSGKDERLQNPEVVLRQSTCGRRRWGYLRSTCGRHGEIFMEVFAPVFFSTLLRNPFSTLRLRRRPSSSRSSSWPRGHTFKVQSFRFKSGHDLLRTTARAHRSRLCTLYARDRALTVDAHVRTPCGTCVSCSRSFQMRHTALYSLVNSPLFTN